MNSDESSASDEGFALTYGMELLFDGEPQLDEAALLRELQAELGDVEYRGPGDAAELFFFREHTVDFDDAKGVPAQFAVLRASASPAPPVSEEIVAQSWSTPGAADIAARVKHRILCTDLMSSGLDYKVRQRLLSHALRATARASNCIGIVAVRSQQILAPDAFIHADDPLFGFVNVRLFNAGEQGMVMDTLGLAALGLYDVQCHFTGLEPGEVAGLLHSVARYIFEEEPEFENGHTIQGINDASWKVQFEESLVEPNRLVLDVNPGAPFAVGR